MANDDLTPEQLNSELEMLNSQLIRTGELITTLFSVQYFDIHSVSLFRENVQISYLLDTEYEVYSRMHEHIQFINNISDEIGFAFVDRIQLQQVVSNLLNNAIKFANKEKPVILIEAYKNDDHLHIAIEDNGGGFQGADVSKLFDKYSTFGSNETIGLGMGLYLCKKIVDMHQGEIEASVSERC
jgi:signal transduction histidine kinase